MKQTSLLFVILVFLVSIDAITATHLLIPKQGENMVNPSAYGRADPSVVEREEENLFKLMGAEDCDDEDEECTKRRMISDAHLDYIYTQHHNP